MKYWFVKYRWQRPGMDYWNHENAVYEGDSPLTFLKELQEGPESFRMDFFYEIDQTTYTTWKDEF